MTSLLSGQAAIVSGGQRRHPACLLRLSGDAALSAPRPARQEDMEREVEAYLRRRHPAAVRGVEVVAREDLDLKNHLSGLQRRLLKARAPLQAPLLRRPCRRWPHAVVPLDLPAPHVKCECACSAWLARMLHKGISPAQRGVDVRGLCSRAHAA